MEFSRLMIGGNLLAGYAHSRDLPYVSTLMRRYNTPQKIRETLELGPSDQVHEGIGNGAKPRREEPHPDRGRDPALLRGR